MKIIKSLEIILHGISDYLTLIENNGKMFAVWFDEESGDALCIFEEQADEFEKRLREMEKAGMRIGVVSCLICRGVMLKGFMKSVNRQFWSHWLFCRSKPKRRGDIMCPSRWARTG